MFTPPPKYAELPAMVQSERVAVPVPPLFTPPPSWLAELKRRKQLESVAVRVFCTPPPKFAEFRRM